VPSESFSADEIDWDTLIRRVAGATTVP